MECSGVIYVLVNGVNGKMYVGQTYSLKQRLIAHKCDSRHKKTPLYSAIRKYGAQSFGCQVLEFIKTESEEILYNMLNEREQYWIALFDSTSNRRGYNQTSGGRSGGRPTIDTIKKMVQNRRKIPPWNKGQITCRTLVRRLELAVERRELNLQPNQHTPSSKDLLRQANLGIKRPSEIIEKIRSASLGNQHAAKIWQIISPYGEQCTVHNLKKFCEENGLSYKTFSQYASKGKSLHGWIAVPDRICPDGVKEKFRHAVLGKTRSETINAKISNSIRGNKYAAKQWIIERPGCPSQIVTSLRAYCKDAGLCYSALHKYATTGIIPTRGKCAGWKIQSVQL